MRNQALLILTASALMGCQNAPEKPIRTVDYVDIERFMGEWYVIASIPTFIEKSAHNAVESYALNEDGTVDTTFTFREGGFDGAVKTYKPRGFIKDVQSNAVWGMQFIWPIKADYRIVYLTADYSQTVIGRNKRDYVWIMAREPSIRDEDFRAIIALLELVGYDVSRIEKVPQQWNEPGPANRSG